MTSVYHTPKCLVAQCDDVPHTRINGLWWCDVHSPLRGQELIRSLTASLR